MEVPFNMDRKYTVPISLTYFSAEADITMVIPAGVQVYAIKRVQFYSSDTTALLPIRNSTKHWELWLNYMENIQHLNYLMWFPLYTKQIKENVIISLYESWMMPYDNICGVPVESHVFVELKDNKQWMGYILPENCILKLSKEEANVMMIKENAELLLKRLKQAGHRI